MTSLSTYANSARNIQNPKVGQPCCSQFSEDGQWYRAEILEIKGNNASVLFVDYGNKEDVSISTIKEISSSLIELPRLAITCRLDSAGKKWKPDATFTLQEKAQDQLMTVKIKGK